MSPCGATCRLGSAERTGTGKFVYIQKVAFNVEVEVDSPSESTLMNVSI